jgi:GNAT superfamily N-acetyltransferase
VESVQPKQAIELTFDVARLDRDRVYAWLRATYWSPGLRRDVFERAVANSIVVSAIDRASGVQVAFARVVTDRATFAWLCDVFVDPAHRGRGVARAMVRFAMAHPDLTTLRRFCLATRDAHGVYKPLGFAPVVADNWLERRLPPEAWSDAAE